MRAFFVSLLALFFGSVLPVAAQAPPPPPSMSPGNEIVIFEPADPVMIDGKPADELTDDELRDFLQKKVMDIHQEEGQVELIRLARGYSLTLRFDEPVSGVVFGDPALVGYTQEGRILVLSARQSEGDTTMQVILPGSRIFPFHIFVEPTFVSAQTTINVTTSRGPNAAQGSKGQPVPSFAQIAAVVGNYDALIQEGALDKRTVRRLPVGVKSPFGMFQYYDWFVFPDGTSAVSFALTNANSGDLVVNKSRLRLQVGNVRYIPTMVSIAPDRIPRNRFATGFAVFRSPPFALNQRFELLFQ